MAGPLSDPAFRDPSYRAANYNELWQALKRLAAAARRGGPLPHGPVRGAALGRHPKPRRGDRRSPPSFAWALRHTRAPRARGPSRSWSPTRARPSSPTVRPGSWTAGRLCSASTQTRSAQSGEPRARRQGAGTAETGRPRLTLGRLRMEGMLDHRENDPEDRHERWPPGCHRGVATSDYPYLPDVSEHGVHAQAAKRALADAGLELSDVDGLATTGFFPMYAVGVAEYLGMHPSYLDETQHRRSLLRGPRRARRHRGRSRSRRDGARHLRERAALADGEAARHRRPKCHAVRADGLRGLVGQHARRQLRPGGEAPHARVRNHARAAGRGGRDDASARGAQPDGPVPGPDNRRGRGLVETRRRSSAQARLLRHLGRRSGACVVTTAERAADLPSRPVYITRRRSRHDASHQHLADARPDGDGRHARRDRVHSGWRG